MRLRGGAASQVPLRRAASRNDELVRRGGISAGSARQVKGEAHSVAHACPDNGHIIGWTTRERRHVSRPSAQRKGRSTTMMKHQLLRKIHGLLEPRTYFEVGVRKGRSLTLSRVPSVGVDPYYEVTRELLCDVHLVRTTSDEFFARRHPFAHLAGQPLDFAFIDGMHLAEYALRDVINTERHCHAASVIVVDDILPRTVEQAGRGRVGAAKNGAWAGDVYKIVDVLRYHRPDLAVIEVDTTPTGTLVILVPDPQNRTLTDTYEDVVSSLVVADPQELPEWAILRTRAVDPAALLRPELWAVLRRARSMERQDAVASIRGALEHNGLLSHGSAS